MTTQIADAIEKALIPRGVFVVIEAEHLCMSMRGVRKPGTVTVTSAVRGLFRSDPRTRQKPWSTCEVEASEPLRLRCVPPRDGRAEHHIRFVLRRRYLP